MEFQRLAKIYESLEATTKRLEMTEILFEFLKSVPEDILDIVVYFLLGKIFPDWIERELGVGGKLLIRIISKVTGVPENEIEDYVREEGDFGKACERAARRKKQIVLFSKSLTVSYTYYVLKRVSEFTGPKSQERKLKNLSNLFSFATPREVRYLSRIILGEMRTGVGEGTLRDAIANAFGYEPFEVERAYMLTNDLGAVAKAAKSKRLEELNVEIFKPIKFMLAQVSDFEDAFQRIPKAFCEIKYDGSRAQIHRKSDVIKIFSRRLENITEALPDLVNALRMSILKDSITEGEIVAVKNGKPQPFQQVLRRLRRKYDIDEMIKKIPLSIYIFDCLFCEKSLIDEPLERRRGVLESIVSPSEKAVLSELLYISDPQKAQEFFSKSIEMGHEGLMIKDPDSIYQPGARGKKWLKIKQVMETLDLVVIGAEWGEGRRAHWLASFLLGIRDEYGNFLEIGKVGTGITDEMFSELTEMLKPLIEEERGKVTKISPKLVLEIAFDEIQASPNYESGYALRFPRLVRLREDKSPEEADDLERLEEILKGKP